MPGWLSSKKSPQDLERVIGAAIEHHNAGRLDDAEAGYREVLAHDAQHVDALHFLGFIAFQRGELARAVELITRALALNPANPHAQQNLGNAYQALGDAARAAACFRKAMELKPQLVDAHFNLGIACRDLGQREEAAACFLRVLELRPQSAEAHFCLGHLYCDEDRVAEGLACFARALELKPEYAEARWSLALARIPQVYAAGEDPARARSSLAGALEELERWFDEHPSASAETAVGSLQPFSLAYREEPNRELLERYGGLCARLMESWRAAQPAAPRAPPRRGGRLRVGIVSAHFHNHSVWHALVRGWLAELDPARFELVAFHVGTGQDAETAFARSRVARFEQGPRPLARWVEAIESIAPQVLIYPEVGMDPVTLQLAALRLAPVQAASWGHPETTGLPSIDYYLSAQDLEPAGAQANYAEELVALPHLGCYFEPRGGDAALPEAAAASAAEPLLVCPGVPFKYAPEHDWIFPAIAQRLGRCRLHFFTHANAALSDRLRERLRIAFAARGLEMDRFVSFLPWLPNAQFQALMRRADVFLDTIGFSGFNTALQAVQCGLPIVAREGRFLRGRLASGILERLGLAELVAPDEAGYVERVARIARDAAYRSDLRRRMAAAQASLFRDRAPIRALEEFLLDA